MAAWKDSNLELAMEQEKVMMDMLFWCFSTGSIFPTTQPSACCSILGEASITFTARRKDKRLNYAGRATVIRNTYVYSPKEGRVLCSLVTLLKISNSWTAFLVKVSVHKLESSQLRVFVWFSTLIFSFYRLLFMNRLEFSSFADSSMHF